MGCFLLLSCGWLSARSQDAARDPNPYAVISERNVFHLNPIPPPPAPEAPKADLPVIKLSGFFKIGTKTRALFSSLPKKKEEAWTFYNLAEGEKEGILEVLKIDEAEGKVEVLNTGTRVTLTLKDDAIAPGEAAGPGKLAHQNRGAHPFPPGMPARRVFTPPGMTRAGATPGTPPTRQRRIPLQQ